MKRTLVLLSERNHYFQKFKAVNEAELIRLKKGDFTNIDIFYKNRESLLNMVAHIEDLIEKRITMTTPAESATIEMRTELLGLLKGKDQLIKDILAQDLEILGLIDREKSKIITDLKTLNNGRKALSAYQHSSPSYQLDEEL
jgi:hypothetical protein